MNLTTQVKHRLEELQEELSNEKEKQASLQSRVEQEKEKLRKYKKNVLNQIAVVKLQKMHKTEGNLEKQRELQYGTIPQLEKRIKRI